MPIIVTVTKTPEEFWLSPEDEQVLSDGQILELIQEDTSAFLEGACWTVERLDALGSLSALGGTLDKGRNLQIEPRGPHEAKRGSL